MKVICLTTVLWCNGNNATGYACDVYGSLGSILARALTFFILYNNNYIHLISDGIRAEFRRNPSGI